MQVDKEEMLDVFRFDPNFEENEMLWEQIKKEILGDDDEDDEDAENEEDGEWISFCPYVITHLSLMIWLMFPIYC